MAKPLEWEDLPIQYVYPGETNIVRNLRNFLKNPLGTEIEIVDLDNVLDERESRIRHNNFRYKVSPIEQDRNSIVELVAKRTVDRKLQEARGFLEFRVRTRSTAEPTGDGRAGYDAVVETRDADGGFDVRFGSGDPAARTYTEWYEIRDGVTPDPPDAPTVKITGDTVSQAGYGSGLNLYYTVDEGSRTLIGAVSGGQDGGDGDSVSVSTPTPIAATTGANGRGAGSKFTITETSGSDGSTTTHNVTIQGGANGVNGVSPDPPDAPVVKITGDTTSQAGYGSGINLYYTVDGGSRMSIGSVGGGQDGEDGTDGTDGKSSKVVVVSSPTAATSGAGGRGAGATVTFATSTDGVTTRTTAVIQGGANGADGVSPDPPDAPSVSFRTTDVSQAGYGSGKNLYYTVDGTETSLGIVYGGQDGEDGEDGTDGADGTSSVVVVSSNPTAATSGAGGRGAGATLTFATTTDGTTVNTNAVIQGGANGKDGVSPAAPTVKITGETKSQAGHGSGQNLYYTVNSGSRTLIGTVDGGADGEDGEDGTDGADGTSSVVVVSSSAVPATSGAGGRGAGVTLTFATTTDGTTVNTNAVIQGGSNGNDGVSPAAPVVKITGDNTSQSGYGSGINLYYTVNSGSRTLIGTVGGGQDGEDGTDGADGTSSVVVVSSSAVPGTSGAGGRGAGAVVTFATTTNGRTVNRSITIQGGANGADGETPETPSGSGSTLTDTEFYGYSNRLIRARAVSNGGGTLRVQKSSSSNIINFDLQDAANFQLRQRIFDVVSGFMTGANAPTARRSDLTLTFGT